MYKFRQPIKRFQPGSLNGMSPHRLAISVLLFLMALYAVAPLSYRYDSVTGLVVLSLGFLIFILFSVVSTYIFNGKTNTTIYFCFDRLLMILSKLCLIFALIGVALRLVDGLFVRGFDFSEGIVAFRLGMQDLTYSEGTGVERAGITSAIGAIFCGFTYPLGIFLIYWWKSLGKKFRIIAIPLASYPAIEGFIGAGVWGAAFLYLFLGFAWLHRLNLQRLNLDFQKRVVKTKLSLFLGLAAGVGILFVGGELFVSRIEYMFNDLGTYLSYTAAQSFVVPPLWLYEALQIPIVGDLFMIIFWLCDYLLQSPAEFSYFFTHFDDANLMLGAKQFFVINKFLSIVGLTDFSAYDLALVNPRPGRYQTFIADVYMDFGIIGVVTEMCILGIASGWLFCSRRKGNISGIFIYPFVQAMIVSGFLINGFAGQRFYFLTALLIICLFIHLFRAKYINK